MGLFDFVGDLLGLSPPSASEAMSKEDLAWLMEKGIRANQIDQQGIFTGSRYTGGEGTNQPRTQTTTVNPALQPAIDRLLGGLTGDIQPYKNPFGDLMSAMLEKKHQQYGLGAPQMPNNAVFSMNQGQVRPYDQGIQPPAGPPAPPQGGVGGFSPTPGRPWRPAYSEINP